MLLAAGNVVLEVLSCFFFVSVLCCKFNLVLVFIVLGCLIGSFSHSLFMFSAAGNVVLKVVPPLAWLMYSVVSLITLLIYVVF